MENQNLNTGKIATAIITTVAVIIGLGFGTYMLFYRNASGSDKKNKNIKPPKVRKNTLVTTDFTVGDSVKVNEDVDAKVVSYTDGVVKDLSKTYKIKKGNSAGIVIENDTDTKLTLTRIDTILFYPQAAKIKTYFQIKTSLLEKDL